MKLLSFLFLMFITSSINAQEIDTLTFQQANDINYFQKVSNGTGVKNYIASDGSMISLKDILVIGKPTISIMHHFEFIIYGKTGRPGSMMWVMDEQSSNRIDFTLTGERVIVNKITVWHNGGKKRPLKIMIHLGEINGRFFGSFYKYLTVVDYDLAFNNGEIRLLNQQMTRAEAIAKLKEAKDLVDLGMMSKEDFEKLKAELSKIIIKQQ